MSPSAPRGAVPLALAGQSLHLLPQRAVWWPECATVFVADLHLGKAATLRRAGLPVPGGTTSADLRRLSDLLAATAATRLVVLGDLIHARGGRQRPTLDAVGRWRDTEPALEIELVRGNHDRGAGDPPADWRIRCHDEPRRDGPLVLRHHPEPDAAGPVLAGHLHPAVRLQGGGERLKLPCFLLRDGVLVLPAFSGFVDHGPQRPRPGDRLWAVADDEVVPLAG